MLSQTEILKRCGGYARPDHYQQGMTLLDYFAGQALVGLLSFSPEGYDKQMDSTKAAKASYIFAIAMLDARAITLAKIKASDDEATTELPAVNIFPAEAPAAGDKPEHGNSE